MLFFVITVGIFVVIVSIISGWLYYKYAHTIKTYPICIYKAKGVDLQKYIEAQHFVVKPGINRVTLNIQYKMILDPVIDQMLQVKLPQFLERPINIVGEINAFTIGKILGVPTPRPVACLRPVSPDEIELFAGPGWYLWGSTKITKKLLPTRLELSDFKLYTFKIHKDYLDYIFSGDVNTTIQLSGQYVSPADIRFTQQTVDITYKVSDLLVK